MALLSGEYEMAEGTGFKKWYDANKAEFNRKRKERYAADPERREQAITRQREYRRNNPTRSRATSTRMVNGKAREVFRIGAVAEHIGRTEQVLRLWESKNLIPKPTVKSAHRYYTAMQVALLKGLAEVMDEVRYKPSIREEAISKQSSVVHSLWES